MPINVCVYAYRQAPVASPDAGPHKYPAPEPRLITLRKLRMMRPFSNLTSRTQRHFPACSPERTATMPVPESRYLSPVWRDGLFS